MYFPIRTADGADTNPTLNRRSRQHLPRVAGPHPHQGRLPPAGRQHQRRRRPALLPHRRPARQLCRRHRGRSRHQREHAHRRQCPRRARPDHAGPLPPADPGDCAQQAPRHQPGPHLAVHLPDHCPGAGLCAHDGGQPALWLEASGQIRSPHARHVRKTAANSRAERSTGWTPSRSASRACSSRSATSRPTSPSCRAVAPHAWPSSSTSTTPGLYCTPAGWSVSCSLCVGWPSFGFSSSSPAFSHVRVSPTTDFRSLGRQQVCLEQCHHRRHARGRRGRLGRVCSIWYVSTHPPASAPTHSHGLQRSTCPCAGRSCRSPCSAAARLLPSSSSARAARCRGMPSTCCGQHTSRPSTPPTMAKSAGCRYVRSRCGHLLLFCH